MAMDGESTPSTDDSYSFRGETSGKNEVRVVGMIFNRDTYLISWCGEVLRIL